MTIRARRGPCARGLAVGLAVGACAAPIERAAQAPSPAAAASGALLERWVELGAQAQGDGSAAHPFPSLQAALSTSSVHLRIHLGPGVHAGPFRLKDVEVVGTSGDVVLASAPGEWVMRIVGTVRLDHLQIRAAAGGIEVAAGASMDANDLRIEAAAAGGTAVRVDPAGTFQLRGFDIRGPFHRGVDAERPRTLLLVSGTIDGAQTGLRLVGGEGRLTDVRIRGGSGPAVSVNGGVLDLLRVLTVGHEYGVLAGEGTVLTASDLRSADPLRAGLAVVKARAVVDHLTVERAGSYGGIQSIESDLTVRGAEISGSKSYGIVARGGRLEVQGARVVGTRDPDGVSGDAVHLRAGRAELRGLRLQGSEGAGLLAGESAHVRLVDSSVEGARVAGIAVDTFAEVELQDVRVERTRGPGLLVTDHGVLTARRVESRDTREGPLSADCANGARARLSGFTSDSPSARVSPNPGCVERSP